MRILACLVGASAITGFLFLFVYSLAGVSANELCLEDAFILFLIWSGSAVSGLFGPMLLNNNSQPGAAESTES